MRVLVACEFSGVVREAFRKRGHDAWSCDLLPAEDGSKFHYQEDVKNILSFVGFCEWELMIAHPPCQYLSYAGNVWLKKPGRIEHRERAMDFFLSLACATIKRIAIENPPGYPQKAFRKPDQIIQPFEFGHPVQKKTCLWLKGLCPLMPTNVVTLPEPKFDGKRNRHWVDRVGGGSEAGRKARSRTFQGIAEAMAEQWGNI